MTIQITKPEVEALIKQRLQSGGFKDAEDAEDAVWQALQSSPSEAAVGELSRRREAKRNDLGRR